LLGNPSHFDVIAMISPQHAPSLKESRKAMKDVEQEEEQDEKADGELLFMLSLELACIVSPEFT